MAQVSVFEGGFTLDAAEAVIDLSTFEEEPFVLPELDLRRKFATVREVKCRERGWCSTERKMAVSRYSGGSGANRDIELAIVRKHHFLMNPGKHSYEESD